ncbi:MAG: amidohydrolase family protein [Acidobacteriota bacterium]|nr:MAG: amidohydrolase family protein [Acidobacteriota bacterium]
MSIIDSHCHIGAGIRKSVTCDALLRAMDDAGVDRAVVCTVDQFLAVRNREGNDDVLEAVRACPDRFWGLAAANPWFGDQAVEELRRSLDAGLRGLKIASHVQGFVLSDSIIHPLVEVCREYGAPLYAHTGTPITAEPFQLAELARTFPDVTMVMGHMGYTDFWYDAVPAALQSENIYLETSLIDIMNIHNAIEKVGAHRILFGSDFPESDLALELEKIAMIDMDDEARSDVLGRNAQKVWA